MTDVEKLFEAGSRELRLDDLGEISGGNVRVEGYGIIMQLIAKYKRQGKSKEDCIATIRKGWEGDCRFKMGLTDGTDEDLKTILDYVESHW
jgi:hypothetical protein